MIEQVENRICLEQLFKRAGLNEREQRVFEAVIGCGESLKDIGAEEGVSGSRIQQINARTIRKLKGAARPTYETLNTFKPRKPLRPVPPTSELPLEPLPKWAFTPPRQTYTEESFLPGTIALSCDGCKTFFYGKHDHHGGRMADYWAYETRLAARKAGWKITDKQDICPMCAMDALERAA
jgi:hypothetical protein